MNAVDFYEKNKDCTWKMPAAPADCSNDVELAHWLLNKANFGWLELDIDIPIDLWKSDVQHTKFYNHRGNDHPGWNSACIHGIDVDKTGAWTNYGYEREEDVPYKWTTLSESTPSIKSFWQRFPYETYRRIRLMQIEPQGYISPHSDAPGKLPGEDNLDILEFGVPINIAIIHPKDCVMTLEGYGCVPFEEGKAFIINIRNYHSVINSSNQSRIHLISHGIPGKSKKEFAELVASSYRKQYEYS